MAPGGAKTQAKTTGSETERQMGARGGGLAWGRAGLCGKEASGIRTGREDLSAEGEAGRGPGQTLQPGARPWDAPGNAAVPV